MRPSVDLPLKTLLKWQEIGSPKWAMPTSVRGSGTDNA
jgi:hypothetical protein